MIGPYEVRRYPSYVAIQVSYTRRDDAYELLGSLTQGKTYMKNSNKISLCLCRLIDRLHYFVFVRYENRFEIISTHVRYGR
jgi:hypothetical protein